MTKHHFIKHRYIWFILSAILMIPGLISIMFQGFNLGIDFTGGTLLDLKFNKAVSVAEVRECLKDYELEGSTIQLAINEGNTEKSQNVFIRTHVLSEEERSAVLKGLDTKLGAFEILRIEKVGAVIGSELTRQAIIAMIVASVFIAGYISYRFEFYFAISGILALLHDIFIVLGVFSLLQIEIDATFVAALLTIIGFSINDTIVIFDRIRENLKTYKKSDDLGDLIDKSVNQTLARSVYTTLTVLFATASLYFFGGETTKTFSFALLIGFSLGAYSSIFNASPLWYEFKLYSERRRVAMRRRGQI